MKKRACLDCEFWEANNPLLLGQHNDAIARLWAMKEMQSMTTLRW